MQKPRGGRAQGTLLGVYGEEQVRKNKAREALMARVRHQTLTIERFRQR